MYNGMFCSKWGRDPLFILSVFIIGLNTHYNHRFSYPDKPQYCLPYQSMQLPLQIYTHPFPSCLCFYWAIKILPNQMIQNNNFFIEISFSHPQSLLSALSKIFIKFSYHYIQHIPKLTQENDFFIIGSRQIFL